MKIDDKFPFEKYLLSQKDSVVRDFKFLMDLGYASFFNVYDSPEGEQYIENYTHDQISQIIKWFDSYYIPFYEKNEEFEKCARLKKTVEHLKKKIKKK